MNKCREAKNKQSQSTEGAMKERIEFFSHTRGEVTLILRRLNKIHMVTRKLKGRTVRIL